jgi:hypothetical protein
MERGSRGFKGRSQRGVWGLKSPESNLEGAVVTGVKFGWKWKMITWPDMRAPHVSEKKREGGYQFGVDLDGPWDASVSRPNGPPWPFC